MNQEQLLAVKLELEERLSSLDNDYLRAYADIPSNPTIAPSPYPIMMYVMSAFDLFSSLWAGWSDPRSRGSDMRSQTERMTGFLTTFMSYPEDKSKILIQMYRHKLMHTSKARRLLDPETGNIYLMSISPTLSTNNYLKIDQTGKYSWMHIGVKNLIDDLRNAIFGDTMYYDKLKTDAVLQENFKKCWTELNSYTL